MADSMKDKSGRRRNPSDISVYHDAESDPSKNSDVSECSSSGYIDRKQPIDDMLVERSKEESGSASCLPRKAERRRSNSFSAFAYRIFDEKIPLKKKLKWLKRFSMVKDDGTIEFEVPESVEPPLCLDLGTDDPYYDADDQEKFDAIRDQDVPELQVVMLIVGTRGDVQPFIAIGKRLQELGHRVRLATHKNFKEFVLSEGLEFYPLGGDPKVLAGYMVKNKGFLPSHRSEIPIQRNQMKDIINSLLPACKEPDPDLKIPFKADAIIANPPAYGHNDVAESLKLATRRTHCKLFFDLHKRLSFKKLQVDSQEISSKCLYACAGHNDVAESLKLPLHVFFTMPWTPTNEFPHPLSRVKQPIAYRLSYQIVDALIWLGIRDMINEFRKKKLKLRPIRYLSSYYSTPTDVPHCYIWSPHLVPKPKDWGPEIDVVGFCFLDLASNYQPPESLLRWLEAGEKPIYIGFGSLPVQEPEKMTQIIVRALEITGQRGIINKGWGGLGDLAEPKEFVYSLDNCPHDWLFPRCMAVVHHGGGGTTAAGLKAACPSTIVPFFGDQPFWGEQVHASGVGPVPIRVEEFSLEKLVAAIRFMLDPKVKERATQLAKAMEKEDGVTRAVESFYQHFTRRRLEAQLAKPRHRRPSFFSLWRRLSC